MCVKFCDREKSSFFSASLNIMRSCLSLLLNWSSTLFLPLNISVSLLNSLVLKYLSEDLVFLLASLSFSLLAILSLTVFSFAGSKVLPLPFDVVGIGWGILTLGKGFGLTELFINVLFLFLLGSLGLNLPASFYWTISAISLTIIYLYPSLLSFNFFS